MADLVGTTGSALGVDNAEAFVAEARCRAATKGTNAEFLLGSATDLPLPDGAFDMCRAERVLGLMDDPFTAVREMARVVRPGGQVVVFDFDLSACFIDSEEEPLTRRIEQFIADLWPSGPVGRQLPGLFRAMGLVDPVIEPHVVTPTFQTFERLYRGVLRAGLKKNGHWQKRTHRMVGRPGGGGSLRVFFHRAAGIYRLRQKAVVCG